MNEYHEKEARKYQKSLGRLHLIVEQLNALDLGDVTEFEIQPVKDDCDYSPRYIAIKALIMEGPIEIMCERDGYGNADRWEFRAAGWPTFTDSNGKTETVDPSNLGRPRVNRPTTTAAQDRAPEAIAKQIANKLIQDYVDVYKRCLEQAEDYQAHSDKSVANAKMVAEAAKDTGHHIGRRGRGFYVADLPGPTLRIEMKSADSFEVDLSAKEMVAVIGLVRELRA